MADNIGKLSENNVQHDQSPTKYQEDKSQRKTKR